MITTTDRINQALHVLQLALSESGRSNYNRWQVKDAIDQLTAGDVPAATTALKKAVARQQAIERGVRLVEIDEGRTEAVAAAQALAILTGTDSADADVLALHTQACNALATALHHLRGDGCIKTATARAIRAATALKRLSALNMGVTA